MLKFTQKWKLSIIPWLAFVAVAFSPAKISQAHSLDDVEQKLSKRDAYLQVVNQDVPPFSLQDLNGRPRELSDFQDKVIILNFMFASCTDLCPLHTQKLIEIQAMINDTPMRDLVQFISITTDPVQDTPDVLKKYINDQGVDPNNWLFLTSGQQEPTTTRELAQRFSLKFTPTDDGQQVHGAVTHLIDKEGRLRARYHGMDFGNVNFVQYANALVNDFDKHTAGSNRSETAQRTASTGGNLVDRNMMSPWTFAVGGLLILAVAGFSGRMIRYIRKRA
jgi:protein SCO1